MTLWWTPSEVGAMEGRANQDVTDVDEEDGAADLGDPGKPVYLFRDASGHFEVGATLNSHMAKSSTEQSGAFGSDPIQVALSKQLRVFEFGRILLNEVNETGNR